MFHRTPLEIPIQFSLSLMLKRKILLREGLAILSYATQTKTVNSGGRQFGLFAIKFILINLHLSGFWQLISIVGSEHFSNGN
jgi:hypothetical protein